MRDRIRTGLLAVVTLALIPAAGMASLGTYNQDFDGLDINASEIGAGWVYFINVFEDDVFQFDYSGAAPNGAQISGLVDDQRDPGEKQLSVFSDYDCCSPGLGHQSALGTVETNVYREQPIAACNVGQDWSFSFDAKLGNLAGASTATAFIKVLDPSSGYSTTAEVTADMTTTPDSWNSYQLDLPIGAWDGQILQFGFQTVAGNFESSGVFYDNVSFSGLGAGICPFSDDFESYNDQDPGALGDAGYLVFGNVSDPDGNFLGEYGPFPAPNQSGAFSGVTVGEGGAAQGAQQLNTFSDYNNVGAHEDGNLVESIVYREQTVGTANIGETWVFSFDAKLGNLMPPTTARAFIKTIDPDSGFATTNDVGVDTTFTPASWQGYQLSLPIDAGLVGQLIQIGFSNTATDFNASGVYYDNIDFATAETDSDGDGVDDSTDNCTNEPNPGQEDFNGDDIGDICDPDVTGPGGGDDDCVVNFLDLLAVKSAFFSTPSSPAWNEEVDFDNDDSINFSDIKILKARLFGPPGPSAAGCN